MPPTRSQVARAPSPPAALRDKSLIDGLQQRSQLFELILADLLGPRTILRPDLLPAEFVPGPSRPADRGALRAYAAELVHCPDGVWRVASDVASGPDNHPFAWLLEAPALAVFLPSLCRFLLGDGLRLASVPSRWLADPGALPEVIASPHRWAIVDAFRPGPAVSVVDLTTSQRIALQDRVAAAPWRFAARLLVPGDPDRVAMARSERGDWMAVERNSSAPNRLSLTRR